MALSQKPADIVPGHAFAETRNRYPRDTRLRRAGFTIASRPKTGEPTWFLGGREFGEREAVALADDMAERERG